MATNRVVVRNCLINLTSLLVEEMEQALEDHRNPVKRIWCREWLMRRGNQGASNNLLRELRFEDPQEYRMMLRMTPEKFDYLLGLVTPIIQREDTVMRDSIKPETMLEVTLNFLATGNNYRTLSHLFRVSKSAVSIMIPVVCQAVYTCLQDFVKVPDTHDAWKAIAEGFESRWNFPFCCGAIDGKHVLIEAPPHSGSEYFNYKGSFSVVLMAVVDHNYCFTYFKVGTKGSNSDGGVFQQCDISEALEGGLLPDGYFLAGDDAFPLKPYLLKPYSRYRLPLSDEEKIFNYRLSRARRIVENGFGILVSRFRVFDGKVKIKVSSVNKLVSAAITIHNWLRKTSPAHYFNAQLVDSENQHTGEIIPGQWRQEIRELRNLQVESERKTSDVAKQLRHRPKEYFISDEGAVPWQNNFIH